MPYASAENRRAYCRKRYATDPEYRNKALQRGKRRDKSKFNSYRREWRKRAYVVKKERDYQKKWEAKHPRRNAEHSGLWRARKVATSVGPVDYTKTMKDARGKCQICLKPFGLEQINIDHIIPLARGGTHTQRNLQASHASCNRKKWAHLPKRETVSGV